MKHAKLVSYVGKKVEIKFFDDDIVKGTLQQGLGQGNDYIDNNPRWFRIKEERLNFRSSHVKTLKVIEDES